MTLRRFINAGLFVSLLFLLGFLFSQTSLLQAEQSGGSPESGSTSRLETTYDSVVSLSYGSISAGSWGDWGTYWNRIRSAAEKPFNDAVAKGLWNGTGAGSADCVTTFDLNCYTKAKGGVDDYNNNNTIPSDAYKQTWTTCNAGNTYCSTGRSVAEKQDPNTDLVWSPRLGTSDWFDANNCKYPNGLTGDDGVCDSNGEVACYCVKHTGEGGDDKTGCEAYDDGNWRLPTQKELMQAYIDGSWASLTNPAYYYWSGTTTSNYTHYAWRAYLHNGITNYGAKTYTGNSVRCVR